MYVRATPSASGTASGLGFGSYDGACEVVARGRQRGWFSGADSGRGLRGVGVGWRGSG